MIRSRQGLAILILCVSTMAWTVSRSSAQRVPISDLPSEICGKRVLENPLLCGCFAFSRILSNGTDWKKLRIRCEGELNGNLSNGRDFCQERFIERGKVQRSELGAFFRTSFDECAVPFYDLPAPPSPAATARIVHVSEGRTEAKFQHYFSGDQEVSFHPTLRMDISRRGYYRLNGFCYTFLFHQRIRNQDRAKRICG